MLEIKNTKWGVASRVGNAIYMNRDLYDYPLLCKTVLKHEKEHSNTFTFLDLMRDIDNKELKQVKKQYYSFLVRHPRALTQFVPIWRYEGTWAVDVGMIFIWLFALMIGGLVWLIAF